ncbi:MAG TPA: hypothetical protein VHU60_00465 [Gaiellaceae bacterium]|nr:hypothetical protein [Gaiellaceae bacterium]
MNQRSVPPWARDPQVRIGAVVAVALLIGLVVWLLVRGNGSGTESTTTGSAFGPIAATQGDLRSRSIDEGHPIYWAGPKTDTTYELTRTSNGRIFIRYLPKGVPVGVDKADYTIVGTYPVPNATGVLEGLAKKSGEHKLLVPGGGIAVYSSSQPTNVYVAYPGSNLQIEVFDPSADRARRIVTSGQVAPVH